MATTDELCELADAGLEQDGKGQWWFPIEVGGQTVTTEFIGSTAKALRWVRQEPTWLEN